MRFFTRSVAIALLFVTVTGCGGGSDFGDLRAFMDDVNKRPKPPIAPLPPFEQIAPFAYQASTLRSPFEPPVLVKPLGPRSGPKVKPDLNRTRQFLEQYTIASLAMVGTLEQGGSTFGLIKDGDGGVHRVQQGDFMGTDHGKIENIGEASIELIEIVADGTGGWVERSRTVNLGSAEKG